MPFSISEFNSSLSQNNGLLYSSHFYVQITPPKCIQSGSGSIISSIPTFCDATQMPGLQYQPFDIRPQGFGLYESRPIQANFPNVNLTFYCDGNGNLQKLFQKWMQNIQNFTVSQGTSTTVNGAAAGVFNYPEWYETTIQIFQFDPTGQDVVCTWTLYNAYPMTMNPIPVSWDQPDQLLKLSVDFYIKQWGTDANNAGDTPGADSNQYNMTRIDPSVSQALTDPAARNSAINGNFSTNNYAPLTTDNSVSAPAITGNAPGTIASGGSVPVFSVPGTNDQTGFGSTFVTFNGQ